MGVPSSSDLWPYAAAVDFSSGVLVSWIRVEVGSPRRLRRRRVKMRPRAAMQSVSGTPTPTPMPMPMWFCFSAGEGLAAVGRGSSAVMEVVDVKLDAVDDVLDTTEFARTDGGTLAVMT